MAALAALAEAHPELAPAVALEREILEGERRLHRRLGTPWIDTTADELAARLARGERLLDLDQLGLDWPEVRLRVRSVIEVLRRHDVLEPDDARRLQAVDRDADFPGLVRAWFDAVPGRGEAAATGVAADPLLGDVLGLAARPFLTRATEVLLQRVSVDGWARSTCPMCGARPSFAVLTAAGERHLVCGRCQSRWTFDARRCHHCLATDRLRTFSAHDGAYQVIACEGCRRYMKALDARRAGRPFLKSLDTVATLALDQALAEQGFVSG